jgi:NADH-quinone oxidoreductase subunit J
MENPSKVFYAALAVLVVGALGTGLASAGAEGLAFALFTVLTLGGALVCIWERSVVRSAFALMATFMGVAGLFVLLHADFLAMAQILIYVGGILALLLFGVMLTPPDLSERKLSRVVGGVAVIGLAFGWVGMRVAEAATWAVSSEPMPADVNNAKRVGVGFLAREQYVVAFELAAVVLTVALVAAVYIARRRRADLEPAAPQDLRGLDEGSAS